MANENGIIVKLGNGVSGKVADLCGFVSLTFFDGHATALQVSPEDAIALAEALEEIARPMLPGGVPTFRDAMTDALGGGE